MFSSAGGDRDEARETSIGSRWTRDRSEVVIYFCEEIIGKGRRVRLCGRPVYNPNSMTCRSCLAEQTKGWPDV